MSGNGVIQFLCGLVREDAGVAIGDDKAHLVRSRLASLSRRAADGSLGGLVARLRAARNGSLRREVVEALLNNETWFFRDVASFSALQADVLPALETEAGRRPVRIWSAACSSGQEPYSVAMLLRDEFPRLWQDAELLASDVSEAMLERARGGLFSQLEVNRGLPAPMLVRNFAEAGARWRLDPAVQARVTFRRLDLNGALDAVPAMDVVLLRNVLLYMDDPTRLAILGRIRRVMRPGGALFLGGAETVGAAPGWTMRRTKQALYYRATDERGRG